MRVGSSPCLEFHRFRDKIQMNRRMVNWRLGLSHCAFWQSAFRSSWAYDRSQDDNGQDNQRVS
jgi:hypothetical protein